MPQTLPIAFEGCAGHLTLPPEGALATGIVLCRSWGVDELYTRKFLRCLADDVAGRGFPVLRFDYPGTVDSLDRPAGVDLGDWTDAADAACEQLRAAGCRHVVLFGFGLGALVAARAAVRRPDAAGLILAAPVASGRRFLRETDIKARIVLEGLGLPAQDAPAGGETSIGGLVLPGGIVAALKQAKIDAGEFAQPLPCLVAARDATGDADLARQLEAAGHAVTVQPFSGYGKLIENPIDAELPYPVIAAMSDWLAGTYGRAPALTAKTPQRSPARLAGDGFVEEGVIFRPDAPLAGILCLPDGSSHAVGRDRTVAVFLNAGYDHHGGWARCWVEAARLLARQGVSSLRFDQSGIGDSPALPGQPEEVLYTQGPIRDLSDALDYLGTACPGRIVVIGRCSGAYTALHAAHHDPRIAALALINQLRLVRDPQESGRDALRAVPRSAVEYRRRLLDPRTVRRLLAGEIDVRAALRALQVLAGTQLARALAPLFPNSSKHARLRAECHALFAELDRRGVPLHFLCADQDGSLEHLALYFGRNRRGLRRFARVSVDIVADADHNLTPPAARQALYRWLQAVVRPADRV